MNVTLPLTVAPAVAVGGTATATVTSASGETAVVAVVESGSVFGPWLVDVDTALDSVVEPDVGAV